MGILSGVSDFFGLDIGTSAIRLVELKGNGRPKSLYRYATAQIDPKISLSDSKADHHKLGQVIKKAVDDARLSTHNVAVGLPSQRIFTTVVDLDKLNQNDFIRSFKYQADSIIPTPISESKVDMAVLGDSPEEPDKIEVLLSSVANSYVEDRLDMLEAIGLNVIAFEPDTMAIARALVSDGVSNPQMILDIGNKSTDLVIVMNGAPRLTRSIPTGVDAIIKSAMQNLSIDEKQAGQFVFKFGLSRDKLEGQVAQAISGTVEVLVNEIDKSLKFFQSRYKGNTPDKIIVTGAASTLPEFPLHLANKYGVNVEIGNAWRNVSFAPDRENELLAVSNHFSVAAGLAERIE